MGLQTVAVFIAGNGRIITENGDAIGERVPVDVNEGALDPSDRCFNVGDAEGGDGTAPDAVSDRGAECVECGGIHGFDGPDFRSAAT